MKVKKCSFGNFSLLISLSPSKTFYCPLHRSVQKKTITWERTMWNYSQSITNAVHQYIFEHIVQVLKIWFLNIYLKHFMTGQLVWQFKFFHMANSWQYYPSFSVPLIFLYKYILSKTDLNYWEENHEFLQNSCWHRAL